MAVQELSQMLLPTFIYMLPNGRQPPLKFLIDDVVYYTFNNYSSLPFNQNFFIILNVAMGGNFAGSVDPSVTSAIMEIDYVRVYQ